jgi:putative transposase
MTAWLRKDKGLRVNKKRIERLYGLMGISAIGPKPNTSKKGKGVLHRIYKYLLKGLKVVRSNQVWAMDITYIPVQGGHLYLCAIIDLYSRYVVGWSLSNTMTSNWCRETLQEAIEKHGKPEILNTDQGSQFTCLAYVDLLKGEGIKISMDGKGRALDNIYIERFWRTIKYQHIYLNPASDGIRLYIGIKKWLQRYHNKNHQGINQKPIEKYRNAA